MSRSGATRAAVAAAAGAVVAGGAAGCLNFMEPEPGPGRLGASLRLTEEAAVEATLDAFFAPGADVGGDVRPVAEPALRILGRTVAPSGEREPTVLRYREVFGVAPGDLERTSVELSGPRLREDRPRGVLTAPLVWRAGPDSVAWAEGEDLELPLRGVPDPVDADRLGLRWNLEVVDPGGPEMLYVAQGVGSLPDTLRVQPDAVAASAGDGPLEARLDVHLDVRRSNAQLALQAPPGYEMSFVLVTRFAWRVARPQRGWRSPTAPTSAQRRVAVDDDV